MNLRLQLIVAVIIVLAIIYIINKVRKGQVDLKYSLTWFAIGIIYLLFDLIPQFQKGLCKLLGISTPQNMLIFLAIGLIFVILFQVTVIVSNLSKKNRKLIQEIGIVNKELEDIKDRMKNESN
jgi:hypothetical protein